MGREIVRQQSIEDLGQRSRLWHHEDIYHVLTKNLGSEAIQGISFDMSRTEYIDLNPCAFANMRNVRYLEFYCSNDNEKNENKVHVSKGLDSVFNELRYLDWYGCPFKSLQSNVNPEHLVILRMQDSNVEQLWNGVMQLVNLKEIDLSGSEHLISCPDLSGARNLETLVLDRCTSLLEISSSLQYLSKLDSLYLHECKNLRGLPDCFAGLKSLRYLNMFGCSYLKMLPDMPCYIEYINLSETAIEELSPAIENLSKLVELSLRNCSRLKSLPRNIYKLKSLEHLFLSRCSKIDKLPDEIGTLESLKTLDVVETAIREVPSSIVLLNNLEMLSFKRCKIQDTMGLLLPPLGLCSLKNLNLTDCGITEIPDSLGHLSQLRRLYLGSNNFEIIPANIINLFNLEFLDISHCQRLRFLPRLPSISINAVNCILLEVLPFLSVPYTSTRDISFSVSFVNCFKLYENGLKDIVENVLQKLESLATLWTKQPYLKDVKNLPWASICYPGSEIPEWFNFQSTGSLIIEELPSCWNNNRFVGFALCAVTQTQHHRIENPWDLSICCECNFKSKDGRRHIVRGQFGYQPYYYHVLPYSVESDHVYIGSNHLMYPRDTGDLCYNNPVTFQFYLKAGLRRIECCYVKSCGVRLMYAQDLGKSNGSFSFDEREDEPQPKRLKSI
ncbi:hypothetical protein LWI29_030319 [Acer saccharum]|uniref:Uncharacterized protein n=1 Tax=Acer saccharum TaxID=4024 RepID=A0AA39TL63_ACESA|nr:hypothetical protein LWI29_030319 [Acer saccharum]